MLFICFLAIVIGECFILFYQKRKRIFQLFSKLNIPGPIPNWIVGNLLELQGSRLSVRLSELSEKFGSVWGFYEGPRPVLILSDVENVQDFYIKNSSNFLARKLLPIDLDPEVEKDTGSVPRNVFQSQGSTWRLLRSATEPAFTDSKLSTMESVIDQHVGQLINRLPEEKPFDIYPEIMKFGLDLNCECFFGISLSKSENSEVRTDTSGSSTIHKGVHNFFLDMQRLANSHGIWALAVIFPEFHCLLRPFCARLVNSPAVRYLKEQMTQIIDGRLNLVKSQDFKRKDLLETLLKSAGLYDPQNQAKASNSLNHSDVVEQVQVFLYAGYETTATALSYVLYCLASNPDIQEELRAELSQISGPVTNRKLKQVTLLNNVIKETLRLHPVVSSLALGRQCTAERSVTINGLQIPAGVYVAPDVHSIHRNPKYWGPDDPNKFNPRRPQLQERNNPAWLAFGVGPRRCMGQKFAMITIRRATYHLLQAFRLETDCGDLELVEGFNILPKSVPIRFTGLTETETL